MIPLSASISAAITLALLIRTPLEVSTLSFEPSTVLVKFNVVLNVLEEELPEERQSRFWAFVLGTAGYTILLLAL